jgi:hypothetical protein
VPLRGWTAFLVRVAPTNLSADSVAGEACFSGAVARVLVPRHALAPRIPSGVTLPGTEPCCACLVACGDQTDGCTFFGGVRIPWSIAYHELMVAVPFARCARVAGDHLFVVGMTCDLWPAVWNGNVYYGFRKRFVEMQSTNDMFRVVDGGSGSSFEATFEAPSGDANRCLEWIDDAAQLPVLGERIDRSLVRCQFEWSWEHAVTEQAPLRIDVRESFGELPTGTYRGGDVCAYRVRGMRWRVSWPIVVS